MVAMAYAARHPDHPSKLVFSSTAARHDLPRMVRRFAELGGAEVAAAARRFWEDPGRETLARLRRAWRCRSTARAPRDPDANARTRCALDVMFALRRAARAAR